MKGCFYYRVEAERKKDDTKMKETNKPSHLTCFIFLNIFLSHNTTADSKPVTVIIRIKVFVPNTFPCSNLSCQSCFLLSADVVCLNVTVLGRRCKVHNLSRHKNFYDLDER